MAIWGPTSIAANGDNGWQEAGVWVAGPCFFGNNGSVINMGLRWVNVTVPNGATIDNATLVIVPRDAVTGTITNIHGTWKGMAFDDVAQWSEGGVEPTSTQTTASVDFDPTIWTPDDTDEQTFTVTSIVAEIIGRVGWASGNALAIALIDDSTTASNFIRAYAQNDTVNMATLTITYTEAAPNLPRPQAEQPLERPFNMSSLRR